MSGSVLYILFGTFCLNNNDSLQHYAGHHYWQPDQALSKAHINVREIYGVLAGAQQWAHMWKDSSICFITDNNTMQAALNTGRSRRQEIMPYMRRLFWLAVENNFVPGRMTR